MSFDSQEGGSQDGRFKAVFACAPECIKRIGADGRLIDMNPAGLRMIDAARLEDVRGHDLLDLVDPQYHRAFREALASVFQGKSVQLQFEAVGLKGRRLWMDQSAAPLFDRNEPGKVVEMIAVTRDITALRAVEGELVRAKVAEEVARSKALFFSSIGNDLKTPLNQIVGYGELLKETALEQGRHDELADIGRLLEAAGRLVSLINQMLAVSLEEARRAASGAAAFDLAELVDDAAAAVKPVLRAAAAEVVVELSEAPQLWTGDADKLDQCLRSALSAAAEFAVKGAITINALAVFGQGCPQLQLEIVARGERLEPFRARARHELGLSALKLARDTARLMGGELKISAEPDGARLLLRVPARTASAEPFEASAA